MMTVTSANIFNKMNASRAIYSLLSICALGKPGIWGMDERHGSAHDAHHLSLAVKNFSRQILQPRSPPLH